jgi:hypothetical protein
VIGPFFPCDVLLALAVQHAEYGAADVAAVVQVETAGRKAAVAGEDCLPPPASVAGAVAAVVTVTYNRADYLRQHLDSLLAVHGRDPNNWWVAVGLNVDCCLLPYQCYRHRLHRGFC